MFRKICQASVGIPQQKIYHNIQSFNQAMKEWIGKLTWVHVSAKARSHCGLRVVRTSDSIVLVTTSVKTI